MSTALAVYNGEVNDKLRDYEQRVFTAEQELRESFYHIGTALKRIKDDEPFKPSVGAKPNGKTTFKSWAAYCRSRRCRYSVTGGDRLIRAAVQRELLPNLKTSPDAGEIPVFWTRETCEQMARLETKGDIREAVSRIRKAIKDNERFGTALVKHIVDDMLGITRMKKIAKKKRISETPTLAMELSNMTETVNDWMDSLAKVEGDLWTEVEEESPGTVKRLTQALSEFISFLKE